MPGFLTADRRAYFGFVAVNAASQGIALAVLIAAFGTSPLTAGLLVALMAVPALLMSWLTGFAADYHRTRALNAAMVFLGFGSALFAGTIPFLGVTVVKAWTETALAAYVAANRRGDNDTVKIGFGYDVGKMLSIPLAFALLTEWGRPLAAVVLGIGALSLASVWHDPPRKTHLPPQKFVWNLDTVLPVGVTIVSDLGVGSVLWLMLKYTSDATGYFLASAMFAFGAIAGNCVLLKLAKNYATAAVGGICMAFVAVALWLQPDPSTTYGNLLWAALGFGAATMFQSLRNIVLRIPSGRNQAFFTGTMNVALACGGVVLAEVDKQFQAVETWCASLAILMLALLTVGVIRERRARPSPVFDDGTDPVNSEPVLHP